MKQKLGFIGLGNMGGGMAANLLAAGFELTGFDIDDEKLRDLAVKDIQQAASVKAVAAECEVVVLCLPHPDATEQVIFQELLAEGSQVKTIIETSTLAPEIVTDIAGRLAEKGIEFLSAPMIGGKNSAANKTILFLAEGSKTAYETSKPILEAMGSGADYMGDVPSATLAKLIFNLCRYANLAVAVEGRRLISKYNPNMKSIYEFMGEQSLDNFGQVWREDMKDMMLQGIPFKPSQVPKKDLAMLSDMAERHELDSELIQAIRKTYLSME